MIKTLLIDDEQMALINLSYMLSFFPIYEIAGAFTVPEDALSFYANNEVDLVFLDIEMPRLKGMDLAKKMRSIRQDVLIVFVTAFPDYAVESFEINAQDYLVKPITKERVAITTQKITQQLEWLKPLKNKQDKLLVKDSITGKDNNRFYLLNLEEILYVTSEGRNVFAKTPNGKYKLTENLTYWEECLPQELFCRCHKSYIVNIKKIEYIAPFFKNTFYIKQINTTETVPVSRTFAKGLREKVRL